MDMSSVSGVASLATNANQMRVNDAVDISVLNKALDAQVQGAAQLIADIAESPRPTPSSPDGTGRYIDAMA